MLSKRYGIVIFDSQHLPVEGDTITVNSLTATFQKQETIEVSNENIGDVIAEAHSIIADAEKPRIQKCIYKDKRMFTREQAVEELKTIKKRKNLLLRIYCCEFCHMWHLTHHKRRKR